MATTLHSFIDIFDTTFGEGQDTVQLKKIVIPIIQRDYAQGRKGSDIKRVRDNFLDALYDAITDKPIVLDFIYGNMPLFRRSRSFRVPSPALPRSAAPSGKTLSAPFVSRQGKNL